ncbi:MAG TPA: FAD/NAD(P)-binding oxidoreductase [Gemmatimonadales bacterium]|nr:FAD/NAD(P)-binding oxidoreductase [Gemmatimonadales bacterium]
MRDTTSAGVLVVGAGPAGLAAANAVAETGRPVLVIDQGIRSGGQIWRHRVGDALPRVARMAIASATPPQVSIAHRASVIDAESPTRLIVSFNGRITAVDADAVVIATGAMERLLPFPGWTLPGVTGVGGLQALVKSGLDLTGQRVVLSGSGPLTLAVAAVLVKAGAELAIIAEQAAASTVRRFALRALLDPRRLIQALSLRLASARVPYRTDSWVIRAEGHERVEQVVMRIGEREETMACDWLGAATGLVPRTALASLLGCDLDGDAVRVGPRQETNVAGVFAAGECCGIKGERGALVEGIIAGMAAAGGERIPRGLIRSRDGHRAFGTRLERAFTPRSELAARVTDRTVICRCEGVTCAEIDGSWTQRQAKLWTRLGMGPCQGAVCGPACTTLYGWESNAARPPLELPTASGWAAAIAVSSPPTGAPPQQSPPDA